MSRAAPSVLVVLDIPQDDPARTRNVELGVAIRWLRRAQGWTIEGLALDAGLHPTYLSGIERGVRNPSWAKLCALADSLQVPVSAIAGTAERIAVLTLDAMPSPGPARTFDDPPRDR
jgi:transcriptional regulator with XRE-family HTH domain